MHESRTCNYCAHSFYKIHNAVFLCVRFIMLGLSVLCLNAVRVAICGQLHIQSPKQGGTSLGKFLLIVMFQISS